KGTVSGRLARARDLLRPHLVRRGLTLSAAALAVGLSESAAPAAVPRGVVESTLKAAVAYGAGASGAASAKIVTLAEGVLKTMFHKKLKVATAVLLAVLLLGAGASAITLQAL